MPTRPVEPGFLFGPATAPYQVEGGLAYLVDYDEFPRVAHSPFKEVAGRGCEHELRYRSDIETLAAVGFNSYRFGIEWGRIEPRQGHIDPVAIEHYRRVLETCRDFGLAPVVTLHHFTSPRWLIALGGWEAPELPDLFGRYAALIMDEFGDLIAGRVGETPGAVCTLNEVNTGLLNDRPHFGSMLDAIGLRAGISFDSELRQANDVLKWRRQLPWAIEVAARLDVDPEHFTPWNYAASEDAVATILESHRAAVRAIRERQPTLRVGLTVASQDIRAHHIEDPFRYTQVERAAAFMRHFSEDRFLEALVGDPDGGDFIGVQAYTVTFIGVGDDGHIQVLDPPEGSRLVQLGYEFAPDSLERCIRHTRGITGMPVLVTEFGIGTLDDDERIEYYQRGMQGVTRCIQDGIQVLGFMPWSALDNYEWEHGHGPLFGLLHVDRETMERTVKPSAFFLGNFSRNRELPYGPPRLLPENAFAREKLRIASGETIA